MFKILYWCIITALIFPLQNSFAQSKPLADTTHHVAKKNKINFIADTASNDKQGKYNMQYLRAKYANAQKALKRKLHYKNAQLVRLYKKVQKLQLAQAQIKTSYEHKLQASISQKNALQAKFDKQVSDQQIASQNEKVKSDNRFHTLLIALFIAMLIITSLIFYNQLKIRQLGQVITIQKHSIENNDIVKNRMFSIISHHMRAPVNTLVTFNKLLDNADLPTAKVKLYVKEIKKALNNTVILLENLFNWSSSQMPGYKPALEDNSLQQITNEAISYVAEWALHKQVSIKNNITENVLVYADKKMTEIVIKNILNNALNHTAKNGLIELNFNQNTDKVTFSISDNGTGMDAMMVSRFNNENFIYSNTSQPDTNKRSGLGLILCKTFIAMMNGKISVNSTYGTGSTFYITLPANNNQAKSMFY